MKWTNSYRSFGLKTKRSTGLKTIEHKQAGVCLAAARHASGLGPVAYDDPVDLSEYDIAYTKEDE